jgi:hypothetical protein
MRQRRLVPNHPAAGKAGIAPRLAIGHYWPGLPEPGRSPKIRAERGRLKSGKDDVIIAQVKRGTSAALGKRHKMNPSLFSNLIWRAVARQIRLEKRETGCGWRFTQGGSRSAPLPWATILLPLRGAGGHMSDGRLKGFGRLWANHRPQARPGLAWLFVVRPRPGLPGLGRSTGRGRSRQDAKTPR